MLIDSINKYCCRLVVEVNGTHDLNDCTYRWPPYARSWTLINMMFCRLCKNNVVGGFGLSAKGAAGIATGSGGSAGGRQSHHGTRARATSRPNTTGYINFVPQPLGGNCSRGHFGSSLRIVEHDMPVRLTFAFMFGVPCTQHHNLVNFAFLGWLQCSA